MRTNNMNSQLDMFEQEALSVVNTVRELKRRLHDTMTDAQKTLARLGSFTGETPNMFKGNARVLQMTRRDVNGNGNRRATAKSNGKRPMTAAQKLEQRRAYGRARYARLKKEAKAKAAKRVVARKAS